MLLELDIHISHNNYTSMYVYSGVGRMILLGGKQKFILTK